MMLYRPISMTWYWPRATLLKCHTITWKPAATAIYSDSDNSSLRFSRQNVAKHKKQHMLRLKTKTIDQSSAYP